MSQNSVIFAAFFIGFLIYVTLRGRLAQYVGLFWKPGQTLGVVPSGSQGTNIPPGQTLPAMPSYSDYINGLPSFDNSTISRYYRMVSGYNWSGLPTYNTLTGFNNQAQQNVLLGGPF